MLLAIRHKTTFHYSSPVRESFNELRMAPLDGDDQRTEAFTMTVTPAAPLHWYKEPGGIVHHFSIRSAHSKLEVLAQATVETNMGNPFEKLDLVTEDWSGLKQSGLFAAEFLTASKFASLEASTTQLGTLARAKAGGNVANFLLALNQLVFESLRYDPSATHVHTTVAESMEMRAGVCQDFAHIMISACRSQGVPARYVSGYLHMANDETMRGWQATHAWVEALLPNGKWVALDPTNNLLVNDRFVRVHTGRDYADAAPTKGVFVGRGEAELEVEVDVRELSPSLA